MTRQRKLRRSYEGRKEVMKAEKKIIFAVRNNTTKEVMREETNYNLTFESR